MSDKADEIACDTHEACGSVADDGICVQIIADALRSYASEIEAERDQFREHSISLTADCYKANGEIEELEADRDRLAKEVRRLRSELTILRDMLHEPDLDGDVPAFDQHLIRLIDRALSPPTPEGGGG